jgi:hypothetical protein
MQAYLDPMRRMGYDLHIDPNINALSADGFFDPTGRRIVLKPGTSWQTFVHEYQHLLFESSGVSRHYNQMLATVRAGAPVERVMPPALQSQLRAQGVNTEELMRSLRRQLTHTAANETGAVSAELQALGFRQYAPQGMATRLYALDWQVHELSALGNARTAVQTQQYYRAIAERTLVYGMVIGPIGAPAIGGEIAAIHYREDIRHFLIRMRDGTWRDVSVDEMAQRIAGSDVPARIDQGNAH